MIAPTESDVKVKNSVDSETGLVRHLLQGDVCFIWRFAIYCRFSIPGSILNVCVFSPCWVPSSLPKIGGLAMLDFLVHFSELLSHPKCIHTS